MDIAIKLNPSKDEIDAVLNGIVGYNRSAYTGAEGYQPIAILIGDPESGHPVGGLTGWALYDWFFVQLLHLPEAFRGRGIGTELMNRAEAWSRERGLVGMWLDTFEFQARGFYEKLGFEVFGEIADHPVGMTRYFMRKRFVAPTA